MEENHQTNKRTTNSCLIILVIFNLGLIQICSEPENESNLSLGGPRMLITSFKLIMKELPRDVLTVILHTSLLIVLPRGRLLK